MIQVEVSDIVSKERDITRNKLILVVYMILLKREFRLHYRVKFYLEGLVDLPRLLLIHFQDVDQYVHV